MTPEVQSFLARVLIQCNHILDWSALTDVKAMQAQAEQLKKEAYTVGKRINPS